MLLILKGKLQNIPAVDEMREQANCDIMVLVTSPCEGEKGIIYTPELNMVLSRAALMAT